MAIGDQKAPYIHSSFKNFSNISLGTGGRVNTGKAGNVKIDNKIQELIKIRNELYSQALKFVGNASDLESVFGIEKNSCEDIALEILKTRDFYFACSARLLKYNSQDFNGAKEALMDALGQDFVEELSETTIIKKIIDKRFPEKTLSLTGEEIAKFLKDVFNNPTIPNDIAIDSVKRYRSKGKSSKLYKAIKTNLRSNFKNTSIFNEVWDEFEQRFSRLANNGVLDSTTPATFLQNFKPILQNSLMNFTGRDLGNLMGAGSEEMFASLINSMQVTGNGTVTATVIGSLTENEIENRLKSGIQPQLRNLRDTKEQSYSDLILTRNGVSVRVQAKNYLTPIQKYEQNTEKDILLQAHLLQDDGIEKFFNRMERATDIDFGNIDEIAYTLANEAWFSSAGNVRYKTKKLPAEQHPIEPMNIHQNMIDYILTEALLNYLGVIVVGSMDKSTAILDLNRSNIFFMIGNRKLLPTYKIIDGLITNLQDWQRNVYTLTVRLDTSKLNYNTSSAIQLLKAKEQAVKDEGFTSNSSYSNKDLLKCGTDVGKEIIDNLRIKSINLDVSLKALFDSSYNFK